MIICYYFRYYWIPLLASTLLPICILSTSNMLWHCLTVNVPLACFFLYCVQKVWGYCRASTWKVLQQECYLFPLIIFSSLASVLLYCLKTEISLGKCKGKVSRNNFFLLISHTIGMAVAWLQGRAKNGCLVGCSFQIGSGYLFGQTLKGFVVNPFILSGPPGSIFVSMRGNRINLNFN